jgi:hypothetical protein
MQQGGAENFGVGQLRRGGIYSYGALKTINTWVKVGVGVEPIEGWARSTRRVVGGGGSVADASRLSQIGVRVALAQRTAPCKQSGCGGAVGTRGLLKPRDAGLLQAPRRELNLLLLLINPTLNPPPSNPGTATPFRLTGV